MNFQCIQTLFRGGTSALNIGYYIMSHLSPISVYTVTYGFRRLLSRHVATEYVFNT